MNAILYTGHDVYVFSPFEETLIVSAKLRALHIYTSQAFLVLLLSNPTNDILRWLKKSVPYSSVDVFIAGIEK